MIKPEKMYTISELIKLAKENYLPYVARSSWLSLIESGKLNAFKKGTDEHKTYLIQGRDLLKFLEENKTL